MQLSKNLGFWRTFTISSVVGRTGLEPVTPALSRRCSNQLSYMPFWPRVGGGKETRTPDIKLAKLALYQLSYTPAHGIVKKSKAKLCAAPSLHA